MATLGRLPSIVFNYRDAGWLPTGIYSQFISENRGVLCDDGYFGSVSRESARALVDIGD